MRILGTPAGVRFSAIRPLFPSGKAFEKKAERLNPYNNELMFKCANVLKIDLHLCPLSRILYCIAIHCEDRQSYGRVDCTLEMDDYVYIFEFKMDGTVREALEQIEKNGYAKPYLADKRKVICIGVNFSSATRTIEDWEEITV